MRPSAATVFGVVWGIGVAVAMAAFGNRYGDGMGWLGVAGVGVLLVLPATLVLGYLVLRDRMRVEVEDGTLAHRDMRGRRTVLGSAAVRSVHELTLTNLSEQRSATIVVGTDGTTLLVLWRATWNPHELGRLWQELGWPVRQTGSMPAATAHTRFPGLRLPATFVRPLRTAGTVTLGVLVYVSAWVAVMVTLSA
jgi:hypothetical protein